MRTEVTAAAGPSWSDAAFQWVLSVDDMSFNALGTPDDFESLETKQTAGLMKAQRGELGRQISMDEQAMAKRGPGLNGEASAEYGVRVPQARRDAECGLYSREHLSRPALRGKLQKSLTTRATPSQDREPQRPRSSSSRWYFRQLRKSGQRKQRGRSLRASYAWVVGQFVQVPQP